MKFQLLSKVVVLAAAIAFMVLIPATQAAHQTSEPEAKEVARVASRVSSAVFGFEDKTVRSADLPSKRYGIQVELARATRLLGPIDASVLNGKPANQIGVGRAVGIESDLEGQVAENADGTRIRWIAIKSPGASSIRVHIEGLSLGPGQELYVYGPLPDSHAAGPYTRKGPFGDGDFWTDTIDGDTAIVEYYIKGEERPFRISEISHVFKSRRREGLAPEVLGCELDASCFNTPEKNAVGRIDFFSGGGEFVCTGTLLNDQPGDGAPFFLTANHCVGKESEAKTVEVFWFYQTTACNSNVLGPWTRSQPTGSTLLATDVTSDSTLLSITGNIPSGVVFAGWDSNEAAPGTQVFVLHHPDGFVPPDLPSYLRESFGAISSNNDFCDPSGPFNGYHVDYNQGLTEQGSSGSALLTNESGNDFVVGVLSCGPTSSCSKANFDVFHKFSDFYPFIRQTLAQGQGGGTSGGPQIIHSSFDSVNGVLVIKGGPFSGSLQIMINGAIVSPPAVTKVKGGGAKLKVIGDAAALNLTSGSNTIEVIDNGAASNVFTLTL